MTSFLKSIYRGNIIYAICLIVLGLVFIIWPADSRQLLIRALGALLVLAGAALIVLYFKAKKRGLPVSIVGGVILVVLGILMLAKPENFVQFVIIVAGAFIGASGVLNFCQTLSLAMSRFRLWWVAMILSIFTIVFAVLVISQPGTGASSVPSKTWNIMAAARPVLASFDEGELHNIIEESHCGIFTLAGDKEALRDAIFRLYADRDQCRQMGCNGRQYVMQNLTKEIGTQHYIGVIKSIL